MTYTVSFGTGWVLQDGDQMIRYESGKTYSDVPQKHVDEFRGLVTGFRGEITPNAPARGAAVEPSSQSKQISA